MAGQDYGSNLVPLTLQPPTGASTTDHFCVRWPIIDDRRVEQEECFGVAVVSGDEGAHSTVVFGSPVNATVCIEDDDKGVCMCACCLVYVHNVVYLHTCVWCGRLWVICVCTRCV